MNAERAIEILSKYKNDGNPKPGPDGSFDLDCHPDLVTNKDLSELKELGYSVTISTKRLYCKVIGQDANDMGSPGCLTVPVREKTNQEIYLRSLYAGLSEIPGFPEWY